MEQLLTHCISAFSYNKGLLSIFFVGGLTSGFTHCLVMCGPLVAGQSCAGNCCGTNSSLWSYHLGRMTIYGALGFIASLFAMQVAALVFWPIISSIMLVAAGGMFIAGSFSQKKLSICKISSTSNYLRGAFMGFMPCGVLYAALMMAATLTNPFIGMVAMWLFTIGTVPALFIASGSFGYLSRKWNNIMNNIGRVLMAFNGLSLLVMATRIMR